MSAHLHRIVQEKELTIAELFDKLKEYDKCLDEAEATFKYKLQERSQVGRFLLYFFSNIKLPQYYPITISSYLKSSYCLSNLAALR